MRDSMHPAIAKTGKAVLAATLAFGLGALPLTACGSQGAEQSSQPSESAQANANITAADLDFASWKTLGDALTYRSGDLSYGYDDNYFVCVFDAGSAKVRAVAKAQEGLPERLAEIDFEDEEYDAKLNAALGDLELVSAEDIAGTQLSQDKLDSYIGKTGQDMLDDGFAFSSYYFYGGDETGATMDFENYGYEVTFDTTVAEDQTEDEGEAIKGATVTAIESMGNLSNNALDPAAVE